MKALHFVLVVFLPLGFTACSGKKAGVEDIEKYKTLIVGQWTWVAGDYEGAAVDVANDGKMTMIMDMRKEKVKFEGTYQLIGESLSVDLRNSVTKEQEPHSFKIQRLNQEELILVNSNDEVQRFKRN